VQRARSELPSKPGNDVTTTKAFTHLNYELLCGASAVDGGRFAPSLVVAKQVWPTRAKTIDVPRSVHATADGAIDAAFAHGVEWVATFGN
jgi:hypothetical protein